MPSPCSASSSWRPVWASPSASTRSTGGSLAASTRLLDHDAALVAYVLIVGGLAAKVGWAPSTTGCPTHIPRRPPASALLSAVLLPEVLLIAWRTEVAFAPAIGDHAARAPFLIFGLASVLIAAPFLIRPLAWKRLLAYSSLEHMGVIAVGIGAGNRLALIGAALHVVAHAIVKSVAFLAAIPLLRAQPDATATHPPASPARAPAGCAAGALPGGARGTAAVAPVRVGVPDRLGSRAGRRAVGRGRAAHRPGAGVRRAGPGRRRHRRGAHPPHRAEAPPSLGVIGSIAGVAAALAVGLLVAAAYLPGSQVGDALMGALA